MEVWLENLHPTDVKENYSTHEPQLALTAEHPGFTDPEHIKTDCDWLIREMMRAAGLTDELLV